MSEFSRTFNLHHDFWKSRSWEIKVCFKPLKNFWSCTERFFFNLSPGLFSLQSRTGLEQGVPCEVIHTGKNLFSLQETSFIITGISLWEKLHYREGFPVGDLKKILVCRTWNFFKVCSWLWFSEIKLQIKRPSVALQALLMQNMCYIFPMPMVPKLWCTTILRKI